MIRKKIIDILIPTYNRSSDLEKNLKLLSDMINSDKLEDKVNVIVSDNYSKDCTEIIIKKYQQVNNWMYYFRQSKNLGLERNAIFCLKQAKSDYIMYLGDDDYLPRNYLEYCLEKIYTINNLSVIIPGFSNLYSSGEIREARNKDFDSKIYKPNLLTSLKLTQYGHQLSGLLLKKKNLLSNYTEKNELRNIYPFISFVGINLKRGVSIFSPKYQVLVSQNNYKDWNYDTNGLLIEMFKNSQIIYPESYFKRALLELSIIYHHDWRIRTDQISHLVNCVNDLLKSNYFQSINKVLLPLIILNICVKKLYKKIKTWNF